MQEPNPHNSRLALAAGLAIALALAGAGFLAGRSTAPKPEPAAVEPSDVAPTSAPSLEPVVGPQVLGRAEFIAMVNSAADALASGTELPRDVQDLSGRRFDIVLPFGCEGPVSEGSKPARGWEYDAKRSVLRISVEPERWSAAEWEAPKAPDKEGADADLRGFWILRPWSSAERCPAASIAPPAASDAAPTPSEAAPAATEAVPAASEKSPALTAEQSLAIAGRMGDDKKPARPFKIVKRLAADAFEPARGFHLRLIGRIESAPGMMPIACVQRGGGQQRPKCLVSVTFAELRIENPLDGKALGVWQLDGQDRETERAGT